MNKRTLRPRARVTSALAVFAMVAALVPLIAVPAAGDQHLDPNLAPTGITFTLEGCRGENLPAGYPLEALDFLCDQDYPNPGDTVDAYTTGNLGKTWNELDLVPHRLTADAAGDPAQTYELIIAADHNRGANIGYDLISVPILNTDLSSGTCELVAGDEVIADIGVGGADDSIYRLLTITQSAGSFCVWDYVQRLALTSSNLSGSSLQSNLTAIGVGEKRVPLPVGDISPQELDKDMSASQGADFMWNLTKGATPAEYDFGCTCEEGNEDPSTEVTVTIEWEKVEVVGDLKIITNIYATNPSKRTITYVVSDEIFDALNASQGTAGPVSVDVPPNVADFLVATFEFDISDGIDHLGETWSNTATAELIDFQFNLPIGEIETSSDAVVQAGTQTNATAVITDVESISDSGGVLSYSVDAVGGASGAFQGGYVLGDVTQADVTWVSDAQDADGFVEFTKTVYLDGPAIVTDGELSDVASLLASDGFATETPPASTNFTSDAKVELTIDKTITGGVLGDGQSETFFFDVFDGADLVAGDVEVTITGPATSGSATVEGLEPGVEYTVSEQDIDFWTEGADAVITIDLPNCEGSVLFNNTFAPELEVAKTADASYTERHDWDVLKTVDPEAGVLMGNPGDVLPWSWLIEVFETVVDQDFLVEGQIDVTNPMPYDVEVTVTDELDDGTVADVDCDGFGGNVITVAAMTTESCSYTAEPLDASAELNTAIATTFFIPFPATAPVDFVKNVENDSATVSDTEIGLTDEPVIGGDTFDADDSHICSDDRAIYGDDWMYMADVSNTAILTDAEGTEYESTATTDYKCTAGFVDIVKTTNGQVRSDLDIKFELYSGETLLEGLTTLGDADGILEFQTALVPGDTYTICEGPVPSGFTFEVTPMPADIYPGPPGADMPTGEVQCFDFTAQEKATSTFAVENSFPGGGPRTPGYWKNWSTCSGGNQAETADKLGGTAEGVYLLDDLLPKLVGDLDVQTCEQGVLVLDARKQTNGNKKMANDAAYDLARSYLAAQLNQMAGACDPLDTDLFDVAGVGNDLTFEQVLMAAQQLLDDVGYDGTGSYLGPRDKSGDREIALALHGIIDDYNNGEICTGDPSH